MNLKKKIELILEIVENYENGTCLYCGSTLNGDMEGDDFDSGYPEDWCPDCCESIDPDENWEDATLKAIDKVIHDKKFEP